jgi:hypothetical protein
VPALAKTAGLAALELQRLPRCIWIWIIRGILLWGPVLLWQYDCPILLGGICKSTCLPIFFTH